MGGAGSYMFESALELFNYQVKVVCLVQYVQPVLEAFPFFDYSLEFPCIVDGGVDFAFIPDYSNVVSESCYVFCSVACYF